MTDIIPKSFFLAKLQSFASEMQLMYEIECAVAGNEHPICLGIKQCFNDNLPLDIILSNLRCMATQNYKAIADLIGNKLTDKILNT